MHLPDSELMVIQLLWDRSPQSAEDLMELLGQQRGWAASTVKTLLARLVKKGALGFDRDGRRFLYHPIWRREDYVRRASESFLHTLFGGKIAPLVAQLTSQRKLSPEDQAELAVLLRDLESHGER